MSSSSSAHNTVSLYRYDLTQGMARSLGPMLIGRPLEGIWHTSVVVYEKEYYFDGGVGIVAAPNPGSTRFGQPYRIEILGQTTRSAEEFFAWTQVQRYSGFGPNDYNVLHNNCNSFSDASSMYLLDRHIPQDVLDMIPTLLSTPLGQMLRPMLEQATSGVAGMSPPGVVSSPNPSLAPAALPATAGNRDACAGLLSSRQTVTEDDEEDLMVVQAMMESNETIADGHLSPSDSFEKTLSGLKLLRMVMLNIIEHPTSAKYRALSTASTAYQTKLKSLEAYGVTEIMRIAGFCRRPHSGGTGGEQWYLPDSDGSAVVLRRVTEVLGATISNIQAAADEAAKKRGAKDRAAVEGDVHTYTSGAVQFCTLPFPSEWTPLPVGEESGALLFLIRVRSTSTSENPYCFGKVCFSADQQYQQAHCCTSDGREVKVNGEYEVLCVRHGEERTLTWVPAPLASAAQAQHNTSFIIAAYHHFGIVRAEQGGSFHPGVMEPSGRCVVPYGGRAVVVTNDAEVLCETTRLPQAVLQELEALQHGTHLAELLRAASGGPIGSFDQLLKTWKPPVFYMKPRPLRPHTISGPALLGWCEAEDDSKGTSSITASAQPSPTKAGKATHSVKREGPCLLVCHDMCGGYTLADRRVFLCEGAPSSATASAEDIEESAGDGVHVRLPAVEGAYTPSYWNRADCFVYFSHKRISVPPREWIDSGHAHGVPVLGTILTEGESGAADLRLLLTDAGVMAAIIARLVDVCNAYGFDGYLINFENNLPKNLAKRLVVFCTQLRKHLNRASSAAREASPHTAVPDRLVIWYDAVMEDGHLSYQNALNSCNKPFFDSCDGIFTNYFWNPMSLAMSRAVAGSRSAEVYAGVDVYGRHMYGGGGHNTYVAVAEVVRARLSVALFAPAWTMECEGKGSRDCFQRAEGRMWSPMQEKFPYHARLLSCTDTSTDTSLPTPPDGVRGAHHERRLCAWTSFRSGVGYDFYVNGHRITGGGTAAFVVRTSGWCEVSGAHSLPPFLFQAPSSASSDEVSPRSADATTAGYSAPFAALPMQLPMTTLKHSVYGGVTRAEWRYDKAWFGDRHLVCFVPPVGAAEVLRWYVREALPATPFTELHIEVVYEETHAAHEPAVHHRGLHLALLSAKGNPFQAAIWEIPALASEVAVEGVNGIVARVSKTSEGGEEAGSGQEGSTSRWVRVLYQLRNTSRESYHLTSIAIANNNPHQALTCAVGGVGVSHCRVDTSKLSTGAETPFTVSAPHHPILHAEGPYSWSHHHTFCTRRGSEKVLTLEGAGQVLTHLRAKHGAHVSIVVFASVARAATGSTVGETKRGESDEQASKEVISCARRHKESHTMYAGHYSILDADATYKDSLPIPVSLPSGVEVVKVFYYLVPEGY